MIRTLEALERCAAMLDSIGRHNVPICVYDEALYAAHKEYGAHRLIYMPPQGAPEKAKRGYAADAAPTTKRRKTKWHAESTRASSLF